MIGHFTTANPRIKGMAHSKFYILIHLPLNLLLIEGTFSNLHNLFTEVKKNTWWKSIVDKDSNVGKLNQQAKNKSPYCLGGVIHVQFVSNHVHQTHYTCVETGCCYCSCVEVSVNQTFCLSVRWGCRFSPNTNSYCLLLGWWFWLHTLKAVFSSCLGFKLWVQTVSNGVLGSQLCRLNTRVEGAPPSWVGSLGSA